MNKPEKSWTNAKWSMTYSDLANVPVTAEECYSPEQFKSECNLVFRRAWMFAAHEIDVQAPGSYYVKEFPAVKASIIIVRGKDSVVRGFHNVCRHRCAKLRADGECGKTPSFTC